MALIGHVIGTQMKKTVKVRVPKEIYLEKYKKTIIKHRNYLVHDETESCFVGDVVQITPTPAFSKEKKHVVTQMVKKAEKFVDPDTKFIYTNGHLNIPVGFVDQDGKQRNLIPQTMYKQMGLL